MDKIELWPAADHSEMNEDVICSVPLHLLLIQSAWSDEVDLDLALKYL